MCNDQPFDEGQELGSFMNILSIKDLFFKEFK